MGTEELKYTGVECGPCGEVPRDQARAPNFGLNGGSTPAPAPLHPLRTVPHPLWPPQRIHLRNMTVGLTTAATAGTTHWEKLLIFLYGLPEIVEQLCQNKASYHNIAPFTPIVPHFCSFTMYIKVFAIKFKQYDIYILLQGCRERRVYCLQDNTFLTIRLFQFHIDSST